jgi:hypothetical protein
MKLGKELQRREVSARVFVRREAAEPDDRAVTQERGRGRTLPAVRRKVRLPILTAQQR